MRQTVGIGRLAAFELRPAVVQLGLRCVESRLRLGELLVGRGALRVQLLLGGVAGGGSGTLKLHVYLGYAILKPRDARDKLFSLGLKPL